MARIASVLVAIAAFVVFAPALAYPFLNWDDVAVFARNDALRAPGLVAWAFTTRYMEHFQPLAWLTWAGVDRLFGLTPTVAHALNIVLHAAAAGVVYVLLRTIVASPVAAAVAALAFAIHPLRVEPVVWASAMPYSLALVLALLSTLAWMHGRGPLALAFFVLALLARPVVLALPVLLWVVRRPVDARERAALGIMMLAAVGLTAVEASARSTATLSEIGWGARLTLAATAPWRYLWRSIWPFALTPLEPLALSPRTMPLALVAGVFCLLVTSLLAWRSRHRLPILAAAWLAYILLLVPAMGLVPSGLQATADRYMYLPAIPVSFAIAAALAAAPAVFTRVALALLIGVLVVTERQISYWRDSVTLWTRAVEIDPRNDVALYNLALALDEQGRRDEALLRYEELLALMPNHSEARLNRDLLVARRLEEEAGALAASKRLDAAVVRYREALRLDPRRTHSHAALGMALTEMGRYAEARGPLQAAMDQHVNDPSVPNALAYVLTQLGDDGGAIVVLQEARKRFPEDTNIARNLATLTKKRGGH